MPTVGIAKGAGKPALTGTGQAGDMEVLAHLDSFAIDQRNHLRIAVAWYIPIACNRASADFMISFPLMEGQCYRLALEYDEYYSGFQMCTA